ncbi:sulfur carrier protein ThiS [Lampropedia aestuarii]|uniref:Sulfur carrier protein ThiS n=1 Tax=Lampropedia aestuarii TaxID=2562762 RepID=A0A4S5BUS6_9BURK|nr:sulfur carrier protein ThiS [Lampropedia aestuarii]MDH5856631.1 sulfur carrier protein ThiS [Lampropedia aestuarii]THJ34891.1 sulfur carrier protein ThiS [Lampropedia aestuarii]
MTSNASSDAAVLSISLNGAAHTTQARTVRDLVAEMTGVAVNEQGLAADGKRLGIAVAVDAAVVPRGQWHLHALQAGAQVEVVTAKQGG